MRPADPLRANCYTRLGMGRSLSNRNSLSLLFRTFKACTAAQRRYRDDDALAPPPLKPRDGRFRSHLSLSPPMSRLPFPLFNKLGPTSSPNIMKSPSSFQFDDSDFFAPQTDSGTMTFDSLGFDDANYYESTSSSLSSWEGHDPFQSPRSLSSLSDQRPSTGTHFDALPIFDTHLESSIYPEHHDMPAVASEFDDSSYSCWVNDQDLAALAPTPAPTSKCPSTSGSRDLPSFTPYAEFSYYSEGTFSPPDLVPPRLFSPEKTVEPPSQFSQLDSISPRETSLQPPEWATQLWDDQKFHHPTREPHQSGRPEFSHRSHKRHRYPTRRESPYLGHTLHSSSAPSLIQLGNHQERVRTYSNRADSVDEDNDATIRRKKRVSAPDIKDVHPVEKVSDGRTYSAYRSNFTALLTSIRFSQPLQSRCCGLQSWHLPPGNSISQTGFPDSRHPVQGSSMLLRLQRRLGRSMRPSARKRKRYNLVPEPHRCAY
jgi:hypothetical protein